ncbi:MAG: alkaline phosphatase, partial [Victivallales bacterium]|nr:alkaline phosphatase [Victivallales bacterium]
NNEKSPAYKGDIYELAAKAGYKVVKTREDFRALSRENDANHKVIACGIEGPGYMPNYIDNHEGLLLTDFVRKGIELLDNPKGFFMMCEGGAIDVNCHANDAATVIFETLAFNDAVKVAYEFAQKHPQETLIVITGDHETGALTLGFANTGFRENIDKLALQKSSFGVIKDKLKALGKNKQDLVFDDVKPILTDSFSFKFDGPANDPMTITAAELDQLKAAFDLQYKSEKKNGNAVQVTALKIFNAKVGIAWHSGGHSALPVITSAWGNGSERFDMGEYENTFISHTLKELVK